MYGRTEMVVVKQLEVLGLGEDQCLIFRTVPYVEKGLIPELGEGKCSTMREKNFLQFCTGERIPEMGEDSRVGTKPVGEDCGND